MDYKTKRLLQMASIVAAAGVVGVGTVGGIKGHLAGKRAEAALQLERPGEIVAFEQEFSKLTNALQKAGINFYVSQSFKDGAERKIASVNPQNIKIRVSSEDYASLEEMLAAKQFDDLYNSAFKSFKKAEPVYRKTFEKQDKAYALHSNKAAVKALKYSAAFAAGTFGVAGAIGLKRKLKERRGPRRM